MTFYVFVYQHLPIFVMHLPSNARARERKHEIDIARGFAIFSVVFAHIITGFTSQMIYLFHMPFFFIVSGYLHRVSGYEGQYFRRKCLSLLVPYVIYLYILELPLLSRLISRIVETPSAEGITNFGKMLVKLLYGGETLRGATGVFWFVTCLFLVQQLFNFLSNRIRNQQTLFRVALALYALAYLDQIMPARIVAPFAANVVACAFVFYATGAFFGRYLFTILPHKVESRLMITAIAIALLSAILISAGMRLQFDMKHGYYGYFILSPLSAIAMTKLLMIGSHRLTKYPFISNALASVGAASITIMYVHLSLEMLLPEVLYEFPFIMALIITVLCCLLHSVFTTNRWTKFLFLGRRLESGKKAIFQG